MSFAKPENRLDKKKLASCCPSLLYKLDEFDRLGLSTRLKIYFKNSF